jgi:hypothetical protein
MARCVLTGTGSLPHKGGALERCGAVPECLGGWLRPWAASFAQQARSAALRTKALESGIPIDRKRCAGCVIIPEWVWPFHAVVWTRVWSKEMRPGSAPWGDWYARR